MSAEYGAEFDLEGLPVVEVPVESLQDADSPRRQGEDPEHVRVLMECGNTLPPILVHADSMQVIDGMHRLRAAQLRGQQFIGARIYGGSPADAFVLAVKANVTHGLPLTLVERRSAASRVIRSHPQWSDRMIAAMVGLSPKTVGGLRGCPGEENRHLDSRLGRDGRRHPLDAAQRRAEAARLFEEDPALSLRTVARRVGIAPETARQVRARLLNAGGAGDAGNAAPDQEVGPGKLRVVPDLVPEPEAAWNVGGVEGGHTSRRSRTASVDAQRALEILLGDPALRSTDQGRSMLRTLAANHALERHSAGFVESIPAHDLPLVAALIETNVALWRRLSDLVAHRSREVA